MTEAVLKALLEKQLGEIYEHETGQILYSGIEMLRPGKFYIVGLNPRPDNSNRKLCNIPLGLKGWSAYSCQCWSQKHTHHKEPPIKQSAFLQCPEDEHTHACEETEPCDQAGAEKHQKRVREILEQLQIDPRDVFATNLCFVETIDADELWKKHRNDFPNFWEVHKRFLREVKPEFVICIGYGDRSAFSLIRGQAISSTEIFESMAPHRWGDDLPHIRWFKGQYRLDDGSELSTTVIGIFHLAYRGVPPMFAQLLKDLS